MVASIRAISRPVYIYLRTMIPFAVLWYCLSLYIGNQAMLPTPIDVLRALGILATGPELWGHMITSMRRLAVGYGLAIVFGLTLGICMGQVRLVHELVDPVIELLRPVSGIAWIPLALILLGVGDDLTMFILFYGSVFPMIINTVAGVRGSDPVLIRAARTFGVSRFGLLTQVVLPGALPTILVGARISLGAAWMSIVAAELIGAPTGLGFAIEWYRQMLMTPKTISVIIVIGMLGYCSDRLLRYVRGRLTPWAVGLKVGE